MGALWLMFPYDNNPNNWISFFPCSEQRLPYQNYVFYLTDKLSFIVFAWLLLNPDKGYRFSLWVFFWVQVVRVIDYFITFNEVWTWIKIPSIHIAGEIIYIPIDTNTVGMGLFIFAIGYEQYRKYADKR